MNLDNMLEGYITCALWSSTDTSKEDKSFDDLGYTKDDIDLETLEKFKTEIAQFSKEAKVEIEMSGLSDDLVGHNFWLTRNGHGTGFGDRGLTKANAEALIKISKSYGHIDLYIGDDGKIYA